MRGLWIAVLVGSALMLAACGGSSRHGSTPGPTPTGAPTRSTVSTSPTASQTAPLLTGHGVSPGESPPTRPASSLAHTSDGALVFAGYFYRALDWSIATSDPHLLKQISSPSCIGCNKYIDSMTAVESSGGYSSGGRVQVTRVALVHVDSPVVTEYTAEVTLTQTSQIVVGSAGASAATYVHDKTPVTNFLHLEWSNIGWSVAEIGNP